MNEHFIQQLIRHNLRHDKLKRIYESWQFNNLRKSQINLPRNQMIPWNYGFFFQLNKAEGNFVKFKSTFFGTFATNGLFLPPSSIDFDSLFANFLDRLISTPHVLATFIVLFTLMIVLTMVLRRKDKRDLFMVGDIKLFFLK